jgi:hypothetical protein
MNMSQHDRPPRISDIGGLATPALANGGVWAGRVVWLATPEPNRLEITAHAGLISKTVAWTR